MGHRRRKAAKVSSMTGHGRGQSRGSAGNVEIEVSSVNRRQLDVRVNIPREMSMLEPMIHDLVGDKVARGSVSVVVRYAPPSGKGHLSVDEGLARKYVKEFRRVGKKLNLRDDLSMKSILTLPDVVKVASPKSDAGVRDAVRRALSEALTGMLAMREREGRALTSDIQKRFKGLGTKVRQVKSRAKNAPQRYKKALVERMKKLGADLNSASPQVLRELAIFADKADITEEIIRLESHLAQSKEIFEKGGSVGRTLDFLCQEIFREINTIGSKANDTVISRTVVDFKAELEAIREQVQNVE